MALKKVKTAASGAKHSRRVTRVEAKAGARKARREEGKAACKA